MSELFILGGGQQGSNEGARGLRSAWTESQIPADQLCGLVTLHLSLEWGVEIPARKGIFSPGVFCFHFDQFCMLGSSASWCLEQVAAAVTGVELYGKALDTSFIWSQWGLR